MIGCGLYEDCTEVACVLVDGLMTVGRRLYVGCAMIVCGFDEGSLLI